MNKIKEEALAHKVMKEEAMKVAREQRQKSLTPLRTGRPTLEEDRAAMKEVLNPVSHKKQALKLFDEVITASSEKVFKKLLQKALDDGDNQQMAALKLIADRLAPITQFTEQGSGTGSGGKVVINIAGLSADSHSNTVDVTMQGRVIDAEDVE